MGSSRVLALAGVLFLAGCSSGVAAEGRKVVVNGVRLPPETVEALDRLAKTRVPDGNYWYDRVSGLWGWEGGPTEGVTAVGLDLGGPLRADASRGKTGVFINGREIHRLELAYLQQLFGPVREARYWLNADGDAGFEGGPAQFNLVKAIKSRQPQRRVVRGWDLGTAVVGNNGGAVGVLSRTGGVTFGPEGPVYDH
jgi:hypothetical protein